MMKTSCIAIRYHIETTQHLNTDIPHFSWLFCEEVIFHKAKQYQEN